MTGPMSSWRISRAEEYTEDLTGLWTRGLLIRRSLS